MRTSAVVLASAALALCCAGCATLRGGVVSETTPCAQVIPLANSLVHERGTLVRIRALKRRDARALLDRGPLRVSGVRAPRKSCVVVYRGRFTSRRRPRPPRRYLVLLISVRHSKVLAEFSTDDLPAEIRRAS